MTRIGDSSDDQRIAEMNEAQYRDKVDREKRTEQERHTKSFQEVMSQKAATDNARRLVEKKEGAKDPEKQPKDAKEKSARDSRASLPKGTEDAKRRAMLQRAMEGGVLTRAREGMTEAAREAETQRVTDLTKYADEDRERVEREVEGKEAADLRQADQRHAEKRVDPDGERKHQPEQRREGRGSKSDGESVDKVDGASAADGPRAAHMVKLPQEIIEHIAKAIAVATAADGRTELQISLKGTMLDGITLKVSAKNGKVKCTFEGCDRNMKNLIESSKGELMRQLSKRGLELEILRAR